MILKWIKSFVSEKSRMLKRTGLLSFNGQKRRTCEPDKIMIVSNDLLKLGKEKNMYGEIK